MKLLIVDDGHYVVEYLKHLLDWKSYGINQIQTSTNSIEAKQILDANEIDILITDIRMPEVSGIDLLEHIHLHHLKTKVIFLSGYSQFDYAQKGIRLGVLDYLLKPVDKEDMEKAISQAIKAIDAQPKYKTICWEQFDGPSFLLSILCEESVILAKQYETNIQELNREHFCFFSLENYQNIDEALILDHNDGLNCFIWRTESMLTGLIRINAAKLLAEKISSLKISSEFQLCHKHSVRLHFYQFFYAETINLNDFEQFQNMLQLPSFIEIESFRKQIYKKYNQFTENKYKLIFITELLGYLYKSSDSLDKTSLVHWMLQGLKQPDDTLQSILFAFAQLDKNRMMSNEHTIRLVREYIDSHLESGLSLEELGDYVHLHPVYLSKLYKQETGENLSAYIATKRLDKATKLLEQSNLHIVDISQMVGYKKTQYFIKLFKEKYGVTPQQYRKQHRHS